MNMKLKLIAAALALVAAGSAQAAMQGATSGNGELLLNLRIYNGAQNAGGDDMSAVFDLGVTMNDYLAIKNTAGFTQTWNLNAANYGSAFADILAFAGANAANIEYNVIALDNTGTNVAGGSRYLTTAVVNPFPALSNSGLNGFSGMNSYLLDNNSRGTHDTQDNGASTAVQTDGTNVYFGSINGGQGDTWKGLTTADTTAKLGVAQNFWFLTTSSTSNTAQSTKQPFGVDFNGNSPTLAALDAVSVLSKTGTEFGKWNVVADGTVTFVIPSPVPEPETYALMLAGLGLVGFMARRRKIA
jgi:hypothetical protein